MKLKSLTLAFDTLATLEKHIKDWIVKTARPVDLLKQRDKMPSSWLLCWWTERLTNGEMKSGTSIWLELHPHHIMT